eukprot:s1445_g11.t1
MPKYHYETHVADLILTTRPIHISALVSIRIQKQTASPVQHPPRLWRAAGTLSPFETLSHLQRDVPRCAQLIEEGFHISADGFPDPQQLIPVFNGKGIVMHADQVDEVANDFQPDDSLVLLDITNIQRQHSKHRATPLPNKAECAPLSTPAVLSSSSPSPIWFCQDDVDGQHLLDDFIAMQISSFKQSPHTDDQDALLHAFGQGHAQPLDNPHGEAPSDEAGSDDTSGYEPSVGPSESPGPNPASDQNLQEVYMYHLQDPPIRAFVHWHDYYTMINDIARCFAQHVDQVVDAHELNVVLPDLPAGAAVALVQLFHDILPGRQACLTLLDVELHGHKIEPHYHTGPFVQRSVLATPPRVTRNGLLALANLDQYCAMETGRCLLFLNHQRWPDYDELPRDLSHGDYIRIAVPPSESYTCATDQLLRYVQRGYSHDEILDHTIVDGVQAGYSPSPLSPGAVQQLRADPDALPEDVFQAMQQTFRLHSQHHAPVTLPAPLVPDPSHPVRRLDDLTSVEKLDPVLQPALQTQQDLSSTLVDPSCSPHAALDLDLHTGHSESAAFVFDATAAEFRPPTDGQAVWDDAIQDVYTIWQDQSFAWEQEAPSAAFMTWYLAPGLGRTRCLYGRRILLSNDFWAWKSQLRAKWQDVLQPDFDVQLTAVLPPPTSLEPGIVGHILLTQQPLPDVSNVLVTVVDPAIQSGHPFKQAHTIPATTSAPTIQAVVGYMLDCTQLAQCSLYLRNHLFATTEQIRSSDGDSFDLFVYRTTIPSVWTPPFLPQRQGAEGVSLVQRSVSLYPAKTASVSLCDGAIQDSLTEEFLASVRAAEQAQTQDPPPIDPTALEAQSDFVQELWNHWHDLAMASSDEGDPVFRVETWFVDHTTHDRCYHPRNVQLHRHFTLWEHALLSAWHDRAQPGVETQFAIVYPTPEDMAPTASLQLVILQRPQPDLRSIVLSVYDNEPDVDPLRTFCLTVSVSISMSSLLDTLHLSNACPPATPNNECLLWFGTIPVHGHRHIQLRTGNAFRLVIRRGIPLDIPTLLAMPDHQIRRELQDAIGGMIFRRPRGPAFLSQASAMPDGPSPIPRDTRPAWLITLSQIFQARSFVEMREEGPVCYIVTWFLHGDRVHRCRDPRTVRLHGPAFQWRGMFVHAWADQLQADEPVGFWIVHPPPPQSPWESHIAHVILTQRLPTEQVAVLLSTTIQDPNEVMLDHTAFIVPSAPPLTELHPLIVPRFMHRRPLRALVNGEFVPVESSPNLHSGVSIVFEVLAAGRTTFPDMETREADGMNLLQTKSRLQTSQLPTASVTITTRVLDSSHPTFADFSREVQVSGKAPWTEQILFAWQDLLPTLDRHDVFLQPVTNDIQQEVILVVGTMPGHVPALLVVEVVDLHTSHTQSSVVWSPTTATLAEIYRLAHLPTPTVDHSTAIKCTVNSCLLLDDLSTSVSPGTRIHLTIDQTALANRQLSIPFAHVFRTLEWLDTHMFLPCYDIPHSVPLHSASRQWTDTCWWSPGIVGTELRLYYDGSKIRSGDTHAAGAAVAAFIHTDLGWTFAGALSTTLEENTTSYLAELQASLIAHKFAYDLLKLMRCTGQAPPLVTFCFDSLTVGKQSEGTWQVSVAKRIGHLIRNLHLWIETAFQLTLTHEHVRAHRGEPGNELVDVLAFAAASGNPLHSCSAWIDYVKQADFVASSEWLWFVYRRDVHWQGDRLCFPAAPSTLPDTQVLPTMSMQSTSAPQSIGHLDLRLGTCNVLSLCPSRAGTQDTTGLTGPARQDALLQQFHDARITVFAFQETRLRKAYAALDSRYWLFRSQATPQGHYGMLVGFSKLHPLGHVADTRGNERDLFFEDHHFAVIATDPRFLLIRVHNSLLKCILIAAHGPHSGHDSAAIDQWWLDLAATIPSQYKLWDRILLTDANTRVGAEPCSAIGSFQSDQTSSATEGFVHFVRTQGLLLPATFANYQRGDGATWRHSGGKWSRIDYIGLPNAWHFDHCIAEICEAIDPSLCKEDHLVPTVHVRRSFPIYGTTARPSRLKLRLSQVDPSLLNQMSVPGLEVDVHTHAQLLQQDLVDVLWQAQTPPVRRRLRKVMSDHTWELVCDKRQCRSQLAALNQVQRLTLLEAWFSVWKRSHHDACDPSLCLAFDQLLCQQDRLIALCYHQFRQLGLQVCKALRADDKHFYADLLTDGAQFLHPSAVQRLWKTVRRSLPKSVQRRLAPNPFQLERLEDQWGPHFQDLEVGEIVDPTSLVSRCVIRQTKASLARPSDLHLADIPSLTQLEDALRATQCDKATGYDPLPSNVFHQCPVQLAQVYFDLVFKEYCWQTEPLQHKGGQMALIPKKLLPNLAKDFRGILLLENLPKRVHAVMRTQLMSKLAFCRSPGQLGGFPGQEVPFGSQALRLFGRLADQHHMNSAILFIDLASAFHHLVREVVVGCDADPTSFHTVLDALLQAGLPTSKLLAIQQLPSLLHQCGLPVHLIRLFQDVHMDTWCTIGQRQMMRTGRGTRPGSPLADIIFHTMMAHVAKSLDDWLAQQEHHALMQELGCDLPTILWADDIAIPVLSPTARQLVPMVQDTLQFARATLRDFGFTLNLALGKTTAVLSFHGTDAAEMRRQYQFETGSGVECLFSDGASAWLHFASTYKHLGTIFSSDHGLQQEISVRIGAAKCAFSHLSRPVLTNRHLPQTLRLQLFHALIVTKLLFGLGAWQTLTPTLFQQLDAAYAFMLRKVLRLGVQSHVWSFARIFAAAGTTDVRGLLAVERLTYAQRVFAKGPMFLQHLVQCEYQQCPHSWLEGLRHDLVWFDELMPHHLPPGWQDDMTGIYDLWQTASTSWKRQVKRAFHRFCMQEHMMVQIHTLHQKIFQALITAGPCHQLPTVQERQRQQWESELSSCRHQLDFAWKPDDPLAWGARIGDSLSDATLSWFQQHYPHGPTSDDVSDLGDQWLTIVSDVPVDADSDQWCAFTFMMWGEHWLPDLLAQLMDGEAERVIEDCYAEVVALFPRLQLLARITQLESNLRHTADDQPPQPHRVSPPLVRQKQATRKQKQPIQTIASLFKDQAVWQASVRDRQVDELPRTAACPMYQSIPEKPVYLLVHLFSGRRRADDFHDHVSRMTCSMPFQVIVLSMDTAVDPELGDLSMTSATWSRLLTCYQSGRVAGTLCGPPCETFSEARFTPPPEGIHSWPRPLRSFEHLFGLAGLTLRELRQVRCGSMFFLQCILILALHMQHGGMFIAEHPAPPSDRSRPSIWTSALLECLLGHPDLQLHRIAQYLWGSEAVKPTGLLAWQMPYFKRDLYQFADFNLVRPRVAAIGQDANGQFRTSRHKEYPPLLGRALAATFLYQLQRLHSTSACRPSSPDSCTDLWVSQVAQVSKHIRTCQAWLPDFQG